MKNGNFIPSRGNTRGNISWGKRRALVLLAAAMAAAGCTSDSDKGEPTFSPPAATAEAEGRGGGEAVTRGPEASDPPQAGEIPEFRFARENDRELLSACQADVAMEAGSVSVTAEIESTGELEGGVVVTSYLVNPQSPGDSLWVNDITTEENWTPNQANTTQINASLPPEFANGEHDFNVAVTYLPAGAPTPTQNSSPTEALAQWITDSGHGSPEYFQDVFPYHAAGCSAQGSVANQLNP